MKKNKKFKLIDSVLVDLDLSKKDNNKSIKEENNIKNSDTVNFEIFASPYFNSEKSNLVKYVLAINIEIYNIYEIEIVLACYFEFEFPISNESEKLENFINEMLKEIWPEIIDIVDFIKCKNSMLDFEIPEADKFIKNLEVYDE